MLEMTIKNGICHIVGAGPGDEGLITVRGLDCIRAADVILYDYLCNPALLQFARAGAEKIFVGKNSGESFKQQEICKLLVDHTAAGKTVCRLKGGDPYVFGRGGEEALALAEAGLDFEVVPGVSSAVAVPAYAGIPVTHRGITSSFAVITGHEDPHKPDRGVDWKKVAEYAGAKVILMGVGKMREIAARLVENGLADSTPVAVISWGTTPRQKTVVGTLADIGARVESSGITAPAVTVVGEVVRFRETLNWFEQKPLFGKRIVVTRTRGQASELSAKLRLLGADVIEWPLIRIERVDAGSWLESGLSRSFDWLVFTSPNAVTHFLDQVIAVTGDIRSIGPAQIAAVGPATAARLGEYGLKTHLQAAGKAAESRATELGTILGNLRGGHRVLWPHGNLARPVMSHELIERGIECVGLEVYRTLPETSRLEEQRNLLADESPDWILFASGSAVENFFALNLAADTRRTQFATIGLETSRKLRERGITQFAQASEPTIDALVAVIKERESMRRNPEE